MRFVPTKSVDQLTCKRCIGCISGDLPHLDLRIDHVTGEIETLPRDDQACQRLMTIPGIRPIIASAMVATIGDGSVSLSENQIRT